MTLYAAEQRGDTPLAIPEYNIEIIEPAPEDCDASSLPPEGNVKYKNYRLLNDHLRAYTPSGDIHTSPKKGKQVAKYQVCWEISPPRAKILELLRPDDPGRDELEAIVRPAPRRGLQRPYDEDTRRFLQRALLSPSPHGFSTNVTPEPPRTPEPHRLTTNTESLNTFDVQHSTTSNVEQSTTLDVHQSTTLDDQPSTTAEQRPRLNRQRTLAEELREAEETELSGCSTRRDILREYRRRGGGMEESEERARLGKLALAVEDDDGEETVTSLSGAVRKLDALLAESRDLQEELAGIHEDLQAECIRAVRCTLAARALNQESIAVRFLDDVVALLRGDVAAAARARRWPFAIGPREPQRNYVI